MSGCKSCTIICHCDTFDTQCNELKLNYNHQISFVNLVELVFCLCDSVCDNSMMTAGVGCKTQAPLHNSTTAQHRPDLPQQHWAEHYLT